MLRWLLWEGEGGENNKYDDNDDDTNDNDNDNDNYDNDDDNDDDYFCWQTCQSGCQ